jgi:hypothetical protein
VFTNLLGDFQGSSTPLVCFDTRLVLSTPSKREMVDVESADHVRSELDPLIQHVVKVPSVQEANVARAQFLALCWSMFVMGWTNSSTGPLLPRIQAFYGVSSLSWSICYSSAFHDNIYSTGRIRSSILGVCLNANGQRCL